MKRRLLNLWTVVSLLLCVAVCVLWVRSYIVSDRVEYHAASDKELVAREWTIDSNRGVLGVLYVRRIFDTPGGFAYYLRQLPHESKRRRLVYAGRPPRRREERENRFLGWLGFSARSDRETKQVVRGFGAFTTSFTHAEIPYWLAALLASAPLLHRVKLRLPRRKSSPGHLCSACGYDLRATPGRCPECGTATPVTTSA